MRVAVFQFVVLCLGKAGFHAHHHAGEDVSTTGESGHLVIARHHHLLGDKFLVFLALVGVLGVKIVVAVAHTESGLVYPCYLHLAVVGVGFVEKTEEWVDTDVVECCNLSSESLAAVDGGDVLQKLLDGFGTLIVELHGIHTDVVECGNLVSDRALLVLSSTYRIDKATQLFLVGLRQHVKRAVAAIIGFFTKRMSVHPATAGVAVKVVGQVGGSVKIVGVYARSELCSLGFLVVASCRNQCHSCNC